MDAKFIVAEYVQQNILVSLHKVDPESDVRIYTKTHVYLAMQDNLELYTSCFPRHLYMQQQY